MLDLDIPARNREPTIEPATESRRYNASALFAFPAFWRGALQTRLDLSADPARTSLVHKLLTAAESGTTDLTSLLEFKAWLAY